MKISFIFFNSTRQIISTADKPEPVYECLQIKSWNVFTASGPFVPDMCPVGMKCISENQQECNIIRWGRTMFFRAFYLQGKWSLMHIAVY